MISMNALLRKTRGTWLGTIFNQDFTMTLGIHNSNDMKIFPQSLFSIYFIKSKYLLNKEWKHTSTFEILWWCTRKAIVFCFILVLFCKNDTYNYIRKTHCFSRGFLCLAKADVTKNAVIQSRNTREKYFAFFVERIAVHGINYDHT